MYLLKMIAHAFFGSIPGAERPYQWLQKRYGGLRNPDFAGRFRRNAALLNALAAEGFSPRDARIFEVGTGRIPTSPAGFWLAGALRGDTFDVSRYLDMALVRLMLVWMRENETALRTIYGQWFRKERYEMIASVKTPEEFLEGCNIVYHCPFPAEKTGFPDGTFDAHVSINTLEHIPEDLVRSILREGRRILKGSGLAAHLVDHSDHWAGARGRECSAHFLKYPEWVWRIMAGNRLAYQNRLRSRETVEIFRDSGLEVKQVHPEYDERAAEWLRGRRKLPVRFAGMPVEQLAVSTTLVVAAPQAEEEKRRISADAT